MPGCRAPGDHRAPRTRIANSYMWLCLDHVRAYNAGWDYFRDMDENEILRYQREAVIGHRPTWPLGSGPGNGDFENGRAGEPAYAQFTRTFFDEDMIFAHHRDAGSGRLEPKERRSLAELDLTAPTSLQEIKMRYKQLVKRYHPDANGGDKAAEERFKSVKEAYEYLLTCGYT